MPAVSPSASFADRLRASQQELKNASGDYGALVQHLESALREVERGEVDPFTLKAAHSASLSYPRLQPLRAAAATDDGLEETRGVLVEIKNRLVSFEQEAGSTKGESGADSRSGAGR